MFLPCRSSSYELLFRIFAEYHPCRVEVVDKSSCLVSFASRADCVRVSAESALSVVVALESKSEGGCTICADFSSVEVVNRSRFAG